MQTILQHILTSSIYLQCKKLIHITLHLLFNTKPMLKKAISIVSIILLIVIISAIAVPYIYQNQIKEEVLKYANKNYDGKIEVEDYSMSLFSNFPNFTFSLKNVNVHNNLGEEFISIEKFGIALNTSAIVFDNKIDINSIELIKPTINYALTETSEDKKEETEPIAKSTDENTEQESGSENGFSLNITNYSIVDANINIVDEKGNDFIKLNNLNHSGNGEFINDVLNLKTNTFIEKVNFWSGKSNMLKDAEIKGDLNLNIDLQNGIYTLLNNNIGVNNIVLNWQGVIKQIDESLNINLKFNTPNSTFKDLLQLVPEEYNKDLKDVTAKGEFKIDGEVNGLYNNNTMPAFKMSTTVKNSSIKYADLPESIDDINFLFNINKPQGNDLDKISVNLKTFKAKITDNKISANFYSENLITDPFIKAGFKANLDFAKIKKAIPLEKDEELNGIINADISLEGILSDLEKEQYQKFTANGLIEMKHFVYKSKMFKNDVLIKNASLTITPKFISLNKFNFKLGESDISATGKIKKYLEFAMKDEELFATLDIKSNTFNGSDFIPVEENDPNNSEENKTPTAEEPFEVVIIPAKINFNNTISIKNFKYETINATNVKGNIKIKNQSAYLNNTKMNIFDGTMLVNGKYSSKDSLNPTMNFKYDATKISIKKIATTFNVVDQIAPIAKQTGGKISAKFTMTSKLDNTMSPVMKTLNSRGNLKTHNVNLKETDFIKDLSKTLKTSELTKNPTMKDVNISFVITNGLLKVHPFNVKIQELNAKIGGTSDIDKQTLNLDVDMDFPRKYLGAEINKSIDKALAFAKQFKSDIKISDKIDVSGKIKGNISAPKYSLTYGDEKAATPEKYLKGLADKEIKKAKKDGGKKAVKEAEKYIKNLDEEEVKDLEKKANNLFKSLF